MNFKQFLKEAQLPGYAQAGVDASRIQDLEQVKSMTKPYDANKAAIDLRNMPGAKHGPDFETQRITFNKIKAEAAEKLRLITDPKKQDEKIALQTQLNALVKKYEDAVKTSNDDRMMKDISNELVGQTGLNKQILALYYKKPEQPKASQKFSLGTPGEQAVRALQGEKPLMAPKKPVSREQARLNKFLSPEEQAQLKAAEELKAKAAAEEEAARIENQKNAISSAEFRKKLDAIGAPKAINLPAQEKLLDDNKSTIPPEMFTAAKNAIQKANTTNDPEDIKMAQELIDNALDNA